MKKTSNLMTIGGILAGVGTGLVGIPIAVAQYYAQIAKTGPPDWWNACVFPMILFGMIAAMVGTTVIGVAGKGADEVPTIPQVEAATVKAVADKAVSLTDAKPSEMPAVPVVIVQSGQPPKPPAV